MPDLERRLVDSKRAGFNVTPTMDDDDRPRPRDDAASRLAKEVLDPYSREELDGRIALLLAEIDRVKAHRDKADAHRLAAEALFRSKPA
jgi:uncharacterized small protein (DUF1192 family)